MSVMNKLYDKQNKITIESLHKRFYIDSEGTLRNKSKLPEDFKGGQKKAKATNWNKRFADKASGSEYTLGGIIYLRTMIEGVTIPVHQVIWAMVHGEWAYSMIDHIDGRGLNNKIENLRKADSFINSRNMKMNSRNTSGITGIKFKEGKKAVTFEVTTFKDSKAVSKTFKDFFEACCYRKSFENSNGYSARHGEIK